MQLTQTASAAAIHPRIVPGEIGDRYRLHQRLSLWRIACQALAKSGVNVMFNGFRSSPGIDVTREDSERRCQIDGSQTQICPKKKILRK